MNTSKKKTRAKAVLQSLALGGAVLFSGSTLTAAPTSEAFTYQGVLNLDGEMFEGQADIRFRLYDAAGSVTQVGPDLYLLGASINGGLIVADLDFGAGAFIGDERWLEIAVRTPAWDGVGDEPAYSTLNPRQAILPTPYALFALNSEPGPVGPQGPQGPQGEVGPEGPQGP